MLGRNSISILILIVLSGTIPLIQGHISDIAYVHSSSNSIGEIVEPLANNTLLINDLACRGIALANDGFVYIVGTIDDMGQYTIVLTKWDADANLIWTRFWNNGSSADAYGIEIYGSDIFVIGRYMEGGTVNALLMKYNTNGDVVWVRLWKMSDIRPCARDISIAPDGAIYIVTSEYNTTAEYYTAHILKYSLGGTLIWYRKMGIVSLLFGQVTTTGQNEIFTYSEGKIKKWNATGHKLLDFVAISSHIEGSPSGNLFRARPMDPDGPFELTLWNSTGTLMWSATVNTLWNESLGGIDWVGELGSVPDNSAYILFPLYEALPNLALAKYNASGYQMWNVSFVYPYAYSYGSITQMKVDMSGTIFLASTIIGGDKLGLALCIYKIEDLIPYQTPTFPLFDPDAPIIDHPEDILCEEGHNDFKIIWHPSDVAPDRYEIHLNDTLLLNESWSILDEMIEITITDLSRGSYNYTIIVFDTSGNYVTDSVIVSVIESLPYTTTTTASSGTSSTSPTSNSNNGNQTENSLLSIGIGAALLVGVVVILMVVKKHQAD